MTGNSNLRGAGIALLAFATYAGSDAVVKWLGGHYSPFQLIFFSQLMAFPLVTLLMIRDRTDGNLRPRHPWWVSLRTGGMVFGGIASFYAFAVLPLAQTYAILFSMPIMITLLSIPVLGERIGLHRGGVVPGEVLGAMLAAIKAHPRLSFAGFMGYDPHIPSLPTAMGWRDRAMKGVRKTYAEALAQVYPGQRIETAILWTRTARLMPLPDALILAALRDADLPGLP